MEKDLQNASTSMQSLKYPGQSEALEATLSELEIELRQEKTVLLSAST